MATVAENSEGSLPLAKIAQLQEQLLQGRVLPQANSASVDVGGDDEATDVVAGVNAGLDGAATNSTGDADDDEGSNGRSDVMTAESTQAYRTPVSSPKTDALKVPRLESAKSAPPAGMEAMINPSPSQEAFEGMTRANSFHAFEGGDTQPLESQVYQDHYQSVALLKSGNATTPKKEKVLLDISPRVEHTYNTDATGHTPRTLQEGDPGFVDLQHGWDGTSPSPTAGSVSELGESVNGEGLEEHSPGHDGVFRRPNLPETPSLAGHKRRRSGEVLTSERSVKKTPGFSQAFGFIGQKGGLMTGSQLFDQTQARSSPLPDAPQSDPALTRPSPNIQNHFAVSSTTVMLSSPIYDRAPPATAGEPRERYITFKESQERKRARLEQDFPGLKRCSNEGFDDFEDDDEDTQEWRIAQKQLRRTLSDQALHELKGVSAHSKLRSRPATSSSPRKPTIVDLRTPATARKGEDLDYEFADVGESDVGEEEGEPIVEDEHVHDAPDDDQQDENDVYDEFGQTVLRSQGPEPDEDEHEEVREEGFEDENEMADEEVGEAEQDVPQVTLVQGSSQQDHVNIQGRSQTGTQLSAIYDSQPLRNQRQQASAPNDSNVSPSCSYVPGSQYAGKTSQDLASVPARRTNGSMGPPTLLTGKSEDAMQYVVPSSPPLAATNDSTVDYTAETSLERRTMLEKLQVEQRAEPEIPESDIRGTQHESSRPATAEDRPNTESNNAPFSTARSHLSTAGPSLSQGAPHPSPLKALGSQQSTVNSQSPRTKAGVRGFAEIAGAAAVPTGSGEDALADVDAVMSNLITAEDQQVLDATSSPLRERPHKRRRAVGKPSVPSSSPVKEPQADVEAHTAAELKPVNVQDPSASIEGGQVGDADILETRALRNSPSKANEQRAASPPPESTPESVKQREQAGARAASQLLAKRPSRVSKPAKLSSTARKASSKPQHQTAVGDDNATPKRGRKSKRASAVEDVQPSEELHGASVPSANAEEPEIEETVVETHEGGQEGEQNTRFEEAAIAAPHRIFTLFKGTFNLFYPATWLGVSNNGYHRVKFDDETVTSIDTNLVARLELALGDQIKVDVPGMKNKSWIVKGFGPTLPPHTAQKALTDIYGHETVRVQAKTTRNSVSGPNAVPQGEGEVLNVAVEAVYLTHAMWTHFSRREFMPGVQHGVKSRLETPSTGVQTPVNAETPTSRSRRATVSTAKAIDKRGSSLRDESAAAARTPTAGVFHGMAFAVSYGQNENEKVNVTRLIHRNGGTILDDGFEGLFVPPNLDDSESGGPFKKSDREGPDGSPERSGLQLKLEHKGLGFVALIADKHSRRAKYVQALALGLPCLSGRWIVDSLDASKNDSLSGAQSAPLAWNKYLLAAGESSYLSGAVRSRDLVAYEAAKAKLDDTVASRPLILNGDGVLIVASKKSKAVWDRRKAFAFLTLALGAGHVKRVSDLQEAKTHVADEAEKWKFVYVDGSVAEASATLFGKNGGKDSKKRTRDDVPAKVDAKAMSATDGKVRIVNDEFVVQSLILGALVD